MRQEEFVLKKWVRILSCGSYRLGFVYQPNLVCMSEACVEAATRDAASMDTGTPLLIPCYSIIMSWAVMKFHGAELHTNWMWLTLIKLARSGIYIQVLNLSLSQDTGRSSPMYVDSSAERMTTAPRPLGSDLKLYLNEKPVWMSRCSKVSLA